MTDNEKELLQIVREHKDPTYAVDFALKLMIDFLKTREAPQDTSFEHLQEFA